MIATHTKTKFFGSVCCALLLNILLIFLSSKIFEFLCNVLVSQVTSIV